MEGKKLDELRYLAMHMDKEDLQAMIEVANRMVVCRNCPNGNLIQAILNNLYRERKQNEG